LVLISTGMSTRGLRRAAELGVNVVGACRVRWALLYAWFAPIVIHSALTVSSCDYQDAKVFSVQLAFWLLIWLVTFASLRIDQRTFLIAASTKMSVFGFLIPLLTMPRSISLRVPRVIWGFYLAIMNIFVCSVSLAGIGRVAGWGCCGPCLAKFIVAKTCRDMLGRTVSKPREDTESSSSESEEEDSYQF